MLAPLACLTTVLTCPDSLDGHAGSPGSFDDCAGSSSSYDGRTSFPGPLECCAGSPGSHNGYAQILQQD